jgi:pimeloyl-ACP methyl ester carboxylesterase
MSARAFARRLIACLGIALAVGSAAAQETRMVDVDGLQIRVRVDGLSHVGKAPVVVFEAGGRSALEAWDAIFSDVAAFAPTVAYDRPGNGSSSPDERALHPDRVADNLHTLLARLNLGPPYVLVGHSWGGPLIRVFAGRHLKDVAGLVYVDPTDMRSRAEDIAYFQAQGYSNEAMAARQAELRSRGPVTGEMKIMLAVSESNFAEFRNLPQPNVPVTVLMSTRFDPNTWTRSPCEPRTCQENWIRFRTKWLHDYIRNAAPGSLVVSENGGHYLQVDEPALVITSIRRVISPASQR